MASLAQIHTIRFGSTGLLPRVEAACLIAARDILNEPGNTANHANRVAWADAALQDPAPAARQIMLDVALNPTVQGSFDPAAQDQGVDDGAVQFIVNSAVNSYAKGA